MARDQVKYLYISLGMLRTSALYRAFIADVEASGAAPADVLLLRMAERYGLTSGPVASPEPKILTPPPPEEPPEIKQAKKNALAALDEGGW